MLEIKYGLTESEFAHLLSTSLLVGEEVKAGAMVEAVIGVSGGWAIKQT